MDNQIWGLLLLALMVAAAWYFQHDRQLRERLTVWQTTAIRDVRPGQVKVTGRASAAGDTLVAPGTGARCLAYSVLVSAGEDDVIRFHRCAPFWLEDDTGRLQVQSGEDVRVVIADEHRRTGLAEDALKSMLAAADVELEAVLGGPRDFRFEESIISEGQQVAVLGFASAELNPTFAPVGPRRPPIGTVLRGGGADRPLIIGGFDPAYFKP